MLVAYKIENERLSEQQHNNKKRFNTMKKYLMLVLFVLLTALGSQAWQFIT